MYLRDALRNRLVLTAVGLICTSLTQSCPGSLCFNHPMVYNTPYNVIRPGSVAELNSYGTRTIVAWGLDNPSGLAYDAAGNLYYGNVTTASGPTQFEIFKRTPDGTATSLGKVRDTPGLISLGGWAFDIAVASSGDVYYNHPQVYDASHNVIRPGSVCKLGTNGARTTVISDLDNPSGLAFDSTGNLYYGNVTKSSQMQFDIFKLAPDGTVTDVGAVKLTSGRVSLGAWAFDVAVGPSGDVFCNRPKVKDGSHNVVQAGAVVKFTPDGGRTTIVAGLDYPSGLACDILGNLYFGNVMKSDPTQFEVFRLSRDGIITSFGRVRDTPGSLTMGAWAFDLAVPEPATPFMLIAGTLMLRIKRRRM